jgi:hypothetical protein
MVGQDGSVDKMITYLDGVALRHGLRLELHPGEMTILEAGVVAGLL